ncbi:cytochrome P450 2C5-like [Discoglossus pictus]
MTIMALMAVLDAIGLEVLLVLVLSCLFTYSTWNQMYRNQNLPPGPNPLPLIGNLLQLKRGQMASSLIEIWEQYGPVYTLYLRTRPVVVLCGYQAVREALIDQGEEFGGRGRVPTLDKVTKNYGFREIKIVPMGLSDIYVGLQELRVLWQSHLNVLVSSPVDPCWVIQYGVDHLIEILKPFFMTSYSPYPLSEEVDDAFRIVDPGALYLLNQKYLLHYCHTILLYYYITGISFSNGERWKQMRFFAFKTLRNFGLGKKSTKGKIQEEAKMMVEEIRKFEGLLLDPSEPIMDAISNIFCYIMFGNRFDYQDEQFKKLIETGEEIYRLMSSTWGQSPVHGYVFHMFLPSMADYGNVIQEKQNPKTDFTMLVQNLFLAAKVHKEIDQLIGRDRMPRMDDRSLMPYTDAVMNEIQRFADIGPLNVTHSVTKDTKFRGYTIPKGTDIAPLLCTVHHDSGQFLTPFEFNPNPFLDENGKFKKNEASMPFSAGKRKCPGESLAQMEFFLLLTTILQIFQLTSEKTFTLEDIAPKMKGFFIYPIPYKLLFIPC